VPTQNVQTTPEPVGNNYKWRGYVLRRYPMHKSLIFVEPGPKEVFFNQAVIITPSYPPALARWFVAIMSVVTFWAIPIFIGYFIRESKEVRRE
jgi:hypothetical protein